MEGSEQKTQVELYDQKHGSSDGIKDHQPVNLTPAQNQPPPEGPSPIKGAS